MTPNEQSPGEQLRGIQEWLAQYEDNDPEKKKIATEAKKTAAILTKLHELDALKSSLKNEKLRNIAEALQQQMAALLGKQVEDKVRGLGAIPESSPPPELNEAYFLGDGNSTRIGNDLNAFDSKEEGRRDRWKELKATGKDKVEPGTRTRISTGQEMLWKNYLRAASDILEAAGYPVKTKTGRFSASRTLKILKGIAEGTIKHPDDVKRPNPSPVSPPTPPQPEPPPVVPPAPPPGPTPPKLVVPPCPVTTSLAPEPTPVPPPPEPYQSPEPTPEVSPEAPSFSRYLKDILADPAAPEAKNLLAKFRSPNGRLWVDRKRADGSVVRIWFSLNLTPEEKSKPDVEFITIIERKLAPGGLRFRVDDLSAGNSWKEKWTTRKAGINALVAGIAAAPEAERTAACTRIAEALFGTEGAAKPSREAFTALLQQYLARPDGKSDVWTAVRNAYWHADGWQDERTAQTALTSHGITTPFPRPTYESARMRVWEKIPDSGPVPFLVTDTVTLHCRGQKLEHQEIVAKRVEVDGSTTWYRIGEYWIHTENLRISYKYNNDGALIKPRQFELMAWQVQTEEPKEPSTPTAPLAIPPPAIPSASPPKPKGSKTGPHPPSTPPPASPDGSKPLPKAPPVTAPPPAKPDPGLKAPPVPAGGAPKPVPPLTASSSVDKLTEEYEQDIEQHKQELKRQLERQKIFWGMGFTSEDASSCLSETRGNHFVGLDPQHSARIHMLNVYPSLDEGKMHAIERSVTAAVEEYLRMPDNLPPMEEIRQFLQHPIRFEWVEEKDSVPAHTRCILHYQLPRDLLDTIISILRKQQIYLRRQHVETLLLSSSETLQPPFSLALWPDGALEWHVVQDGERLNDNAMGELAYYRGSEFCVEDGRGANAPEGEWVPAVASDKISWEMRKGICSTVPPPKGTYVQFCLRPGKQMKELGTHTYRRPVEAKGGGQYEIMPKETLLWHVPTTDMAEVHRIVRHYGRYFRIQFEPPEKPPPPPPQPPREKTEKATAVAVPLPTNAKTGEGHVANAHKPPQPPDQPPSRSGAVAMPEPPKKRRQMRRQQ